METSRDLCLHQKLVVGCGRQSHIYNVTYFEDKETELWTEKRKAQVVKN